MGEDIVNEWLDFSVVIIVFMSRARASGWAWSAAALGLRFMLLHPEPKRGNPMDLVLFHRLEQSEQPTQPGRLRCKNLKQKTQSKKGYNREPMKPHNFSSFLKSAFTLTAALAVTILVAGNVMAQSPQPQATSGSAHRGSAPAGAGRP